MTDPYKQLREALHEFNEYPWDDEARIVIIKSAPKLLSSHDAQAAEIERLREALSRISRLEGTYGLESTKQPGIQIGRFANEIARTALTQVEQP